MLTAVGVALAALREELRFAVRGLLRSPAYSITAVVTLALVSGANLTTLGIADALIWRPLRYLRDPGSVHRAYWQWREKNGSVTTSSSTQFTRFVDLRRDARALADVAVFAERTVPIGEGGLREQQRIAAVSASYFTLFDATPVRGRFFDATEDVTPRGADVAVVTERYWRTRLARRDVIGERLRVGDVMLTIVSIAPAGFDGLNDGQPPAVFVPITTYAASTGTSDAQTYFSAYKWGWVHVLVRPVPGVPLEAATTDVTRIFRASWPRTVADNPAFQPRDDADPRVVLSSVRTGGGPAAGLEARTSLWLAAIAGVVLLIGCANVANLSLTRALGRRHEVDLKRALGVPNARLLLSSALEALVLATAGGALAAVVAEVLRASLGGVLASLRLAEIPVLTDRRAWGMTLGLVATTTFVMAVVPVVLASRVEAIGLLRGSPRSGTRRGRRVRGGLVALQAALSVVLLVGAALFCRSLIAVYTAPLGYDAGRVLVINRTVAPGTLDAAGQRVLREDLLRTARAHPGVEAAAWMSSAPFVSTSWTDLFVEGIDANARGPFPFQATTPDYFSTMGTRIVEGRAFSDADGVGAPEVAVVSRGMANALWPGQSALGKCFRMREVTGPCRAVVGVAEDIVQRTLEDGPRLHYYVPIDQYARTSGNGLLVRVRDDAFDVSESIRSALQAVMPAGGYLTAQSLGAVVDNQRGSWRMGAAILSGFAALALLVAAVGLYGVVNHDIAERRREWAVRVALGADRRRIVAMILGRGLRLVAIGVVPGIAMALAFSRWIRPLLYHTSAADPLAYVVVVATFAIVTAMASLVPAIRASGANPEDVLRSD